MANWASIVVEEETLLVVPIEVTPQEKRFWLLLPLEDVYGIISCPGLYLYELQI
jgi:hypothetical protein